MPERLLQVWGSFRSRQSFWSYVATGVPYVVTWFSGCWQLISRDIVFPCRNSSLLLYRDDAVTEVSMLQPRRPRQEVECYTIRVATGLAL